MENKEYYKRLFPLLSDYELIPNSEKDSYNCISHTICLYDKLSWPIDSPDVYWLVKNEKTKESFEQFYEYHAFEKCYLDFSYDSNYTKVALYTKDGIPTHASIQIDDIWWESKIGQLGIIKHDLFEIEGESYGSVSQIYRKPKRLNEIIFFENFIDVNYESLPFQETKLSDNTFIREFKQETDSGELVWHRDRESRIIEPINETDWLIKLDDELPKKIEGEIFIPMGVYHRLIKGNGDLKIKLKKI
jgi:hypothetical protein